MQIVRSMADRTMQPIAAKPSQIQRQLRRLLFQGPAGLYKTTDRVARERLPRAELPLLRLFNPPLSFTAAPR